MPAVDVMRHQSILDPHSVKWPIRVIGAGATGSRLIIGLLKLGISPELIHVYDNDIVEEHNLANQIYFREHIGKPKVVAINNLAKRLSGEICPHRMWVTKATPHEYLTGIVFMMVDTMLARKEIYETHIAYHADVQWLIETRMGVESGQVYTLDPQNQILNEKYQRTLFRDEDAEESVCGTRIAVGCTAELVSAITQWQFIRCIHYLIGRIAYGEIKPSLTFCVRPYIFINHK